MLLQVLGPNNSNLICRIELISDQSQFMANVATRLNLDPNSISCFTIYDVLIEPELFSELIHQFNQCSHFAVKIVVKDISLSSTSTGQVESGRTEKSKSQQNVNYTHQPAPSLSSQAVPSTAQLYTQQQNQQRQLRTLHQQQQTIALTQLEPSLTARQQLQRIQFQKQQLQQACEDRYLPMTITQNSPKMRSQISPELKRQFSNNSIVPNEINKSIKRVLPQDKVDETKRSRIQQLQLSQQDILQTQVQLQIVQQKPADIVKQLIKPIHTEGNNIPQLATRTLNSNKNEQVIGLPQTLSKETTQLIQQKPDKLVHIFVKPSYEAGNTTLVLEMNGNNNQEIQQSQPSSSSSQQNIQFKNTIQHNLPTHLEPNQLQKTNQPQIMIRQKPRFLSDIGQNVELLQPQLKTQNSKILVTKTQAQLQMQPQQHSQSQSQPNDNKRLFQQLIEKYSPNEREMVLKHIRLRKLQFDQKLQQRKQQQQDLQQKPQQQELQEQHQQQQELQEQHQQQLQQQQQQQQHQTPQQQAHQQQQELKQQQKQITQNQIHPKLTLSSNSLKIENHIEQLNQSDFQTPDVQELFAYNTNNNTNNNINDGRDSTADLYLGDFFIPISADDIKRHIQVKGFSSIFSDYENNQITEISFSQLIEVLRLYSTELFTEITNEDKLLLARETANLFPLWPDRNNTKLKDNIYNLL